MMKQMASKPQQGKWMYETKWVVFDEMGHMLETVTLKHKTGAIYVELEPFEKDLKDRGLFAHAYESISQRCLSNFSFKEKLERLGWMFDDHGKIINTDYRC
jgi:hypothetical protein